MARIPIINGSFVMPGISVPVSEIRSVQIKKLLNVFLSFIEFTLIIPGFIFYIQWLNIPSGNTSNILLGRCIVIGIVLAIISIWRTFWTTKLIIKTNHQTYTITTTLKKAKIANTAISYHLKDRVSESSE